MYVLLICFEGLLLAVHLVANLGRTAKTLGIVTHYKCCIQPLYNQLTDASSLKTLHFHLQTIPWVTDPAVFYEISYRWIDLIHEVNLTSVAVRPVYR